MCSSAYSAHVFLCHFCPRGLAFRLIQFFITRLQSLTTDENPTSLRFRSVKDGLAPPVITNIRLPSGFIKIPRQLLSLLRGNTSTSTPQVADYIEPKVTVHFTPGPTLEAPKIAQYLPTDKSKAIYFDVEFSSKPIGLMFAPGKQVSSVCVRCGG